MRLSRVAALSNGSLKRRASFTEKTELQLRWGLRAGIQDARVQFFCAGGVITGQTRRQTQTLRYPVSTEISVDLATGRKVRTESTTGLTATP